MSWFAWHKSTRTYSGRAVNSCGSDCNLPQPQVFVSPVTAACEEEMRSAVWSELPAEYVTR